MNVVGLLRAALGELKDDGWIQGDWHRSGSHCAVGAIEAAMDAQGENLPFSNERRELYWKARKALDKVTPNGDIIDYNDAEDRTFTDIREAFGRAIKLVKEGGV